MFTLANGYYFFPINYIITFNSMKEAANADPTLEDANATNVLPIRGEIPKLNATVSVTLRILFLTCPHLNFFTACNCDLDGSISAQCNKETGQCICKPGMGGYRCDVCDRGYFGNAPYCSHCGECFENWDRILQDLKSNKQKKNTFF